MVRFLAGWSRNNVSPPSQVPKDIGAGPSCSVDVQCGNHLNTRPSTVSTSGIWVALRECGCHEGWADMQKRRAWREEKRREKKRERR